MRSDKVVHACPLKHIPYPPLRDTDLMLPLQISLTYTMVTETDVCCNHFYPFIFFDQLNQLLLGDGILKLFWSAALIAVVVLYALAYRFFNSPIRYFKMAKLIEMCSACVIGLSLFSFFLSETFQHSYSCLDAWLSYYFLASFL